MKYKNLILAAVLLVVLAVAVGLILGPGRQPSETAPTRVTGILQITEICAKNETLIADNNGKYGDYIELYAPEKAVNLKGYTLTDGKATSGPLGDITIEKGEYRILFISGETTGFGLGASGGDTIQLKRADGAIVAQANTTAMAADQVMLLENGSYTVTDRASPNFPNTAEGLAAFRSGFAQTAPGLTISELLVHNETVLPDEKGVFSDVVELHNTTDKPLNLGRYFLSDSEADRFAYRLPQVELAADAYLVIYCDGENYISPDGKIHANFGLSRGESLYLTDPAGGYIRVNADDTTEDISLQLSGSGEYVTRTPSLGYPNTENGVQQALAERVNGESPLIISEVLLSSSAMPYDGVIADMVEIMNVSGSPVSTSGWYLSDGGDPYNYPLPAMQLEPGACLVLRCDSQGTGFGLSQGETLRLIAPDYRYAPLAVCAGADAGLTMQASQAEGQQLWYFDKTTLGFANTPHGRASYLQAQQPKGLRISEVMTGNSKFLPGPYGRTCDWIELYNPGPESINLKQYCLSTRRKELNQCPLPDAVLQPGQYIVILADESGLGAKQGLHVIPVSLSAQGECVYLSRNGVVEDFAIVPPLAQDTSYGRGQGSLEFSQLASVTPGSANGKAASISDKPIALTAPGTYENVAYLDIALQGAGELYYTTNCTDPDRGSTPYTGPIRITSTTILRVVCYEPGKEASPVADFSYFLNENDSLSVVSLVTDPENLFGDATGIYVGGPNMSPVSPYTGANFWQDWERPATITLFDTDGTAAFSQGCGIKIFGADSRRNEKKSLACMFRSRYGAGQLAYPVFGEGSLPYYEALVLRAGGQDIYHARMRDEVITSLAGDYLGLPVQDYRPVALYLNGQYWGVYYIREKLNDQYVAGHYSMKAEEVTLCQVSQASEPDYVALLRYARGHDLSRRECYDYVASRIDIQNYTDYMIAQMWVNNTDSSNVKFFQNPEGKWTWAFYDTDMSFLPRGAIPFASI